VLSINKLTAGQHRYYVELSGERVDVVESVGDGVEEYYVGGTEARGEWLGSGARQLGLTGDVDGHTLRRVLAGEEPAGESLRTSPVPVRVVGFDVTHSAPKSVSVMLGLGEPEVRAAVRRAHDRAVREALGYLERTAGAVRRGAGGTRIEPANGLIVAAFRHRTSRAGDPQLHTHCLVANLAEGPDGRWSALDGRRIHAHARAASFVYQAVLRSELTHELGVEWLTVRDGIAEVAGVPRRVVQAFSRRRADILAELDRHGTSGARAAEAAALATRRPKDRQTSAEDLAVEWRSRAAELGFGRDDIERLLGTASRARSFGDSDLARMFNSLSAPTGLTSRRSTFSRRDVVQALAERLPVELRLSAAAVEQLADRFLASDRVVPLVPSSTDPETRLAFRRRDGRVLPVTREEWIYSTPELLSLERRLIDTAVAGQGAKAGQAGETAVRSAIAARPTLGAD
jgi:conjugative relaxase-like TrwC/TraI family protein